MGCRWRTVRGKRERTGLAGDPLSALSILQISVAGIMLGLNLSVVSGSPSLTIDELRDATVRIWKDPEKGYFTEAHYHRRSPPLIRPITPATASAWLVKRPTSAMIAHAFMLYPPIHH